MYDQFIEFLLVVIFYCLFKLQLNINKINEHKNNKLSDKDIENNHVLNDKITYLDEKVSDLKIDIFFLKKDKSYFVETLSESLKNISSVVQNKADPSIIKNLEYSYTPYCENGKLISYVFIYSDLRFFVDVENSVFSIAHRKEKLFESKYNNTLGNYVFEESTISKGKWVLILSVFNENFFANEWTNKKSA